MDQDLWVYVGWLALAGVASGYAGGLFGIGGGIMRVPIFLYLFPAFGVSSEQVMHVAVATSLALALPSSISASLAQRRAGNIDVAFLKLWLPALALGVIIGVVLSRYIEGKSIQAAFAIVILIAAIHMLVSSDSFKLAERLAGWLRTFFAVFFGGVSTLLGLTGGTFVTPILNAFGYPIHRAIAVSSVGGVVISTVGAAGYIINGLGRQWSAGVRGRLCRWHCVRHHGANRHGGCAVRRAPEQPAQQACPQTYLRRVSGGGRARYDERCLACHLSG